MAAQTPGRARADELFASWAERSGMLARVTFEDSPDLAEAFAAGMQAQRDLAAAMDVAFAVLAADRNTLREVLRRIALGLERSPYVAADKALAESRKRGSLSHLRGDAGAIKHVPTGATWVTWDWGVQPPWGEVAEAVARLTDGAVKIRPANDKDEPGRLAVAVYRDLPPDPEDE